MKSFITMGPGANVVKPFLPVVYEFSYYVVPGNPYQPSRIFVGKAGAYPSVEHLRDASLG